MESPEDRVPLQEEWKYELKQLRAQQKEITSRKARLDEELEQIEQRMNHIEVHLENGREVETIYLDSDMGAESADGVSQSASQRGTKEQKDSSDLQQDAQDVEEEAERRVLLVDDVKIARMTLRHALKPDGYEVVEAESGAGALRILQGRSIHLVIADLSMPDMDGLELVRCIRSNPQTVALPVLVCTASRRESDVWHAVQLGIQGFLVKPISPEVLRAKVRDLLQPTGEGPRA